MGSDGAGRGALGPSAAGELLYEPRWAHRRILGWEVVVAGVASICLGIASLGPTISLLRIGSQLDLFLAPSMLLLFFSFGVYLITYELRHMPFRVYENGFTEILVSLGEGLSRRERVIPKERIVALKQTMERSGFQRIGVITIIYSRPGSTDRTLYLLPGIDVDDKDRALEALVRLAPDAVDESLEMYIQGH